MYVCGGATSTIWCGVGPGLEVSQVDKSPCLFKRCSLVPSSYCSFVVGTELKMSSLSYYVSVKLSLISRCGNAI